jgi:ABC-type amino acid transport substrate-binding protein
MVVATKDAPPFAFKGPDGQWTGIAIELWERIADKLAVHSSFKEYGTVPDMLAAVADGSANTAVAAITVTSEREKTADFTQPYYGSGLGVAVPTNKEIEWLSTFALENYAIALLLNSTLRTKIDEAILDDLRSPEWQSLVQRYLGSE